MDLSRRAIVKLVGSRPVPERLLRDLGMAPVVDQIPGSGNPYSLARRRGTGELTKVEREVLSAVSHGLTDQMVADLRVVSIETVKSTLQHIRYVLCAKNSTHAVAIALRNGLID